MLMLRGLIVLSLTTVLFHVALTVDLADVVLKAVEDSPAERPELRKPQIIDEGGLIPPAPSTGDTKVISLPASVGEGGDVATNFGNILQPGPQIVEHGDGKQADDLPEGYTELTDPHQGMMTGNENWETNTTTTDGDDNENEKAPIESAEDIDGNDDDIAINVDNDNNDDDDKAPIDSDDDNDEIEDDISIDDDDDNDDDDNDAQIDNGEDNDEIDDDISIDDNDDDEDDNDAPIDNDEDNEEVDDDISIDVDDDNNLPLYGESGKQTEGDNVRPAVKPSAADYQDIDEDDDLSDDDDDVDGDDDLPISDNGKAEKQREGDNTRPAVKPSAEDYQDIDDDGDDDNDDDDGQKISPDTYATDFDSYGNDRMDGFRDTEIIVPKTPEEKTTAFTTTTESWDFSTSSKPWWYESDDDDDDDEYNYDYDDENDDDNGVKANDVDSSKGSDFWQLKGTGEDKDFGWKDVGDDSSESSDYDITTTTDRGIVHSATEDYDSDWWNTDEDDAHVNPAKTQWNVPRQQMGDAVSQSAGHTTDIRVETEYSFMSLYLLAAVILIAFAMVFYCNRATVRAKASKYFVSLRTPVPTPGQRINREEEKNLLYYEYA